MRGGGGGRRGEGGGSTRGGSSSVCCRCMQVDMRVGEEGGWAAGRIDTASINAIRTIKIINFL